MIRQLKALPLVFLTLVWAAAPQVAMADGILQAFFSPGEVLIQDHPYYSDNGNYFAVHQTVDNNLVVYKTEGNKYVWGLNELLANRYRLITTVKLEANGQLVGTDENGAIVWTSPGPVVIYRMETPEVEPAEMEPVEITQAPSTKDDLIPAGTYKTATIAGAYTATRPSAAEKRIGVVFEGIVLVVKEDWSFELLGSKINSPSDPRPVLTTGSLELRGQEICSEANLNSFYDRANRSLLDISGACFSYSKGFEYKGIMFPHCITLVSEEKGAAVILCPE